MPLSRRRSTDIPPDADGGRRAAADPGPAPPSPRLREIDPSIDFAQLLIDGLRELMGVRPPEEDPRPTRSVPAEISTTATTEPKRGLSSS